MEQILDEFEKKIEPHLKGMKLELADLEYVRDGGYNYLRVYVEKEDGSTTTLDDCIDFSREIDGVADDLIDEKFFLEKFENDTIFLLDENLGKVVEIPLLKLKKANLIYEIPNGVLNGEEN